MTVPNIINCGICSLHFLTPNNVWFVEELFRYEDVKKYYVLRKDHAENIKAFCRYIVNANIQKESLNFIIFNNNGEEVGLISAEPVMNRTTNMPVWNVGYAVHPSHRHHGYASSALNTLTNFLLQNFSFQQVILDISMDNEPSQRVAEKCGFTKPNDRTGYIDIEHMEVGMRLK